MALSQDKTEPVEKSLEWERSRLDKEQLEAVETTEGYVRVVAGAGRASVHKARACQSSPDRQCPHSPGSHQANALPL